MEENRKKFSHVSVTPMFAEHLHVIENGSCSVAGGPNENHVHTISEDGSELEEWLGHTHVIPTDPDKKKTVVEEKSCGDCIYSKPIISEEDDDYVSLRCFRYPPVLFVLDGELCQTNPEATRVCGEFKAENDEPTFVQIDERNPECVKAWPECESFEYDPRCCRFPKSCSAGIIRWVKNDA